MKIEVDCNNNRIIITSPQLKIVFDKINYPNQIIELLEEVFNMLDESRLSSATPHFGVTIEKIDEDMRTTIGDW